jgi:hypothetical protein
MQPITATSATSVVNKDVLHCPPNDVACPFAYPSR